MIIMSFVFSKIIKMTGIGVPYPIYLYAGLLPWLFFANSISSAMGALTNNASLIKKIYCKKRKLTNIKLGTVDKISFKDKSFDLVTCFDVLYHKQVKNYKKAIGEFYRVLKPGGILLIRTAAYPFLFSHHDIVVHTKHRFYKTELKNILIKQHFSLLKITYANSLLFPLVIIERGFKKLMKLNHVSSDVKVINPFINFLLQLPLYLEGFLIKYFNFPFGLSIIVIAKK